MSDAFSLVVEQGSEAIYYSVRMLLEYQKWIEHLTLTLSLFLGGYLGGKGEKIW